MPSISLWKGNVNLVQRSVGALFFFNLFYDASYPQVVLYCSCNPYPS